MPNNLFYRRLRKLPNYVRRFGVRHGLRLIFHNEKAWKKRSNAVQTFKVPPYEHPVYLRDSMGDHATFWQCIVLQQYDLRQFPKHFQALMERYQKILKCGRKPLIIDCGANIGLSSLWFSHEFRDAQLIAIEPDKDNLRILKKNLEPNLDKITIIEGGIWNKKTHLRIRNPDAGPASFEVEECGSDNPDAFPAYGVEDLIFEYKYSNIFIIKIDIEGAQRYLFAENTDWIKNTDLIILELEDWKFSFQGSARSFFQALSGYNFDYLIKGENIICFNNEIVSKNLEV